MGRFELSIASCSEHGRRAGNEDAFGAGHVGSSTYAVLCDGAGGHTGGAEAAQRSVAAIEAGLRAAPAFGASVLCASLQAAHAELERRHRETQGRGRMHTTAVVLWIDRLRDRALWSHVGDSRLYRLRYGTVEQLTVDDSVVQRLLESGVLTARQAETHPLKNQLLAALGMEGALEPHLPPASEPLLDGDAFLLATDGWWGALSEADIASTWLQADTPETWLDAMRSLIEARAGTDQDNYSAIAVCVVDPQEDTQAQADAL